ncbi:hypothetical protein [Paraliobacillus ryukyuensis]|uniref:hypothetical protein n=1 Tax=Paraliobacillus ryukyuensis TaxID=200904 RepID=UPI0009A74A5B|nr:hypothetical protein [Paraliobacillus ryukyuensis]
MLEKLEEHIDGLGKEIKSYQNIINEQKLNTDFEKKKLKHFLGDDIYNILKDTNAIIAGGAITSLFTNNEINDIDVYFRTKDDIAKFLAEMYSYHIISHTKKATLFGRSRIINNKEVILHIQAIHYDLFNSARDIFNSFDFTVCMGAYDFISEEFILHRDFLKNNSQRILKFNKGTSFPLMSLIRTHKYEDKGFTISKQELFRIVMTCMNLQINSYEELKDQLGGMYGVNLDKVLPDDKTEAFDLEKAVDKLANLHLDETYFIKPEDISFNSIDDLIENALGLKQRYFIHNNEKYKLSWDGVIDDCGHLKDDAEEVNISEWIKDGIVYKYVKQHEDGRLTSFHTEAFEYKLNEEVEAKHRYGLFLGREKEIKEFYKSNDKSVLLKAKVQPEYFNGLHNGYPTFTKCVPLEVLGKPNQDDEDLPFI